MNVTFKPSFQRDLQRLRDQAAKVRIAATLRAVESAASQSDIPHLTKMSGYTLYYRIRVGDYRLGISIEGDEVTFWRCLPRDQIYSRFP